MSCCESRRTLSPAECQALADAAVRVAERSLFAFAEPAPGAGAVPEAAGDWLAAAVAFRGPFAGRVTLSLPADLARQLCAAFLGESPGAMDDRDAVRDLAGEFANMACGAWLTTLGEAGVFELEHPRVRAVAAPAAGPAGPSEACRAVIMVNDLPVLVTLDLGDER